MYVWDSCWVLMVIKTDTGGLIIMKILETLGSFTTFEYWCQYPQPWESLLAGPCYFHLQADYMLS